ncbi:MAG TPA: lytic transglycosylase domain-containing protein, partial [Planctomycetota bacterium]|nr:lytic transglycosylase domain-containing protein [Planctomycetota bacterium]
ESSEALGAVYWAGRAWSSLGDTAAARARWRTVLAPRPVSWYGLLAARRLSVDAPIPAVAPDSFVEYPVLNAALARAALLDTLGFAPEAKLEYDQMASDADESVERLLATAAAFRERRMASRSINLARRALARGAPDDQRVNRLLYPITQREALRAESKANGLDPVLVAALIRQESSFEPAAVSPAGALGLMQVMPNVGRLLAKGAGFPVWDVNLLEQPDVNIQLGTRHLAELMRGYSEVGHALAAYNAGQSRVTRWRAKGGADDIEVFVERIPYVETRDYVRIIERNQAMYRALYGEDLSAPGTGGDSGAR